METQTKHSESQRKITEEYGAYLHEIWNREEQQKAKEQEFAFMIEENDPAKFVERQKLDMEEIAIELDNKEQRSVSNRDNCNRRRNRIWNGVISS